MTGPTTIRIADAPPLPPSASRPSRPQLPRRQSRFTEEMMEEHTPAPSMYEHEETSRSIVSREPPHSPESNATPRKSSSLEFIARGMNGCSHGAACVILIAIMVEFLTQWQGRWLGKISAQAVALLVFLGLDTLLDVISLIRLHTPWPTWALLLRLINGVAYIMLFLAYVARDRVFPPGFSFWAMAPGVAGPLVYGFLWLLGVWSLAHVALRRHRFGNGLRAYYGRVRDRPQPPPPLRMSTPGLPPRPPKTPAWRRWLRKQDRQLDIEEFTPGFSRTSNPSIRTSLPLQDRNAEKRRRSFAATMRTGSSHTVYSKSDERGLIRHEKDEDGGSSRHSGTPPRPPPAVMKM